jgi:antitoxin (DNA-binding transcriptional repressor) of toxin-antitoxin stability system
MKPRVPRHYLYTITLRGERIADLVPAEGHKATDAVAAVEQMCEFVRSAPRVSGLDIKSLISAGRA